MDRPFFTHHAIKRMEQMGVDRATIIHAIEDSDVSYPATDRGQDRVIFKKGDISVLVQLHPGKEPVVVSVLWNTTDQYEREPIPIP